MRKVLQGKGTIEEPNESLTHCGCTFTCSVNNDSDQHSTCFLCLTTQRFQTSNLCVQVPSAGSAGLMWALFVANIA